MPSRAIRRRREPSPERLQHDFYSATADRYDEMHVAPNDEHLTALSLISALIEGYGYGSVLDVGAGTGRGVAHFLGRHETWRCAGWTGTGDDRAGRATQRRSGRGRIVEAGGDGCRSADGSSMSSASLGSPPRRRSELDRRRDGAGREAGRVPLRENRFANGGGLKRAVKYGLYRAGLWPLAYRLATGGRPYHLNPGDGGVAYSYSVYDSLAMLNEWADRVFLVPTAPAQDRLVPSAVRRSNVLLCALRDGD